MAWTWETSRNSQKYGKFVSSFTGDSSVTTDANQQEPFRLLSVAISFSGTVTNDATVTVDSITGATYDHIVTTFENGVGAVSDYAEYDESAILMTGDRLKVACDVGGATAYVTIKVVLP